jgi:4-amino-4-deoxy-L-arabinose transferase-like glycosyltransferase
MKDYNNAMQNRLAHFFLISGLFLLAFVTLFLLRGADDNSLFRWSWVFANIEASRIYLFITAGLIISAILSQAAIPEEYQLTFLAAFSFAVSTLCWKEPEIIVDASRYFTQAKHLEVYGAGNFLREWGRTIPAWTDMPLLPFLYGLIFKVFGESRAAVQTFTAALFSLTTVLTCLTGTILWNRKTGFAAGLLLLGSPYLLMQVPLMLVDIPTMFFFMLSLYTFLKAMDQDGMARILISTAAILLALLSKYSSLLLLSVLGVALIVYSLPRFVTKDRRPIVRGAIILLIAALASGTVALLNSDVLSAQIALLREYQQPGLYRWGESFHSTFLFQIHPFVTIAALVSIVVAFQERDLRYAIISWLVLLIVVFNIRRIRYAVPAFPMLMLMAGYGMQIIRREEIRRFIIYGIVTTSIILAVFAYLPYAENLSAVNLQHAGAYLNTLDGDEIEVITLPPKEPVVNHAVDVPLLDLFTSKRLQYHYRSKAFPVREIIERSSLRFTWEYRNPAYYNVSLQTETNVPIVIISDAANVPLPDRISRRLKSYRLSRSFYVNDGIFKYTTGVRIYQPLLPTATSFE